MACLASGPAAGESLNSALAAAYKNNPQIEAERARLRATDEDVARAMSGYRPTITSTLSTSVRNGNTDPASPTDGRSRPRSFSLELTQPLFRGFQTRNAVSEAEANVRAGQQSLRSVEQTVLLDAVTAYMNVVRDSAILRLRRANLTFLAQELRATQERFNVGEVTRTDVAQARARRAAAQSAIDLARANLDASRALYRRVVGRVPTQLQSPGEPRAKLPRSLKAALSAGLEENPTVVQALYLEQAARFTVDRIFGELLPQAQLEASYSSTRDPNPAVEKSEEGTVTGRLTIPLYQGGEPRARLRQAKHTHVSRIQEIERARTVVREQVVSAWALLLAARAQLVSGQAQVDANQIALDGVRAEERVGQRTLLDVLDAQQALLDSRVTLVATRRDVVVNAYTLLSAMGQLDGVSYGVATIVYDPDVHYHEVRRKWWSISITDRDGRRHHVDLWSHRGRHHGPRDGGWNTTTYK
ncbi:MAG: TolC family outer membrane protein [Pseudomonadota bacterium]